MYMCTLAGVGDVVPTLAVNSEEVSGGEGSEEAEMGERDEESVFDSHSTEKQPEWDVQVGRGLAVADSTPQSTPSRLNKQPIQFSVPRSISRHDPRRSYYQGLESPAAVRWMQSQKTVRQENVRSHASARPNSLYHTCTCTMYMYNIRSLCMCLPLIITYCFTTI